MTKGYSQFRQSPISPSKQLTHITLPSKEPVTSPPDAPIIDSHFEFGNIPTFLLPNAPLAPHTLSKSTNSPVITPTTTLATEVSNISFPLEAQTESSPPRVSDVPVALEKTNNSRSPALCRMKRRIIVKVTLLGCGGLLVGGVVSLILSHSTTYLIVSWIVLVILFSNVISQELRSYYWSGLKMTLTTLRIPAIKVTHHPKEKKTVDVGRNPALKDIRDTTTYLKALRFLSQDNRESKKW